MATCERRVPTPPPTEFVLALSQDEAEGLRSLLGWRVGINALHRYGLQDVYAALRDAGVDDGGVDLGRDVVGFLKVAE